jgi:hypothetical protein
LRLGPAEPYQDHVEWIRTLPAGDGEALVAWLHAVAGGVLERGRGLAPPDAA